MVKELWKKFKLFLFHWYYGKDAFKIAFSVRYCQKNDVIHNGGNIQYLVLSNGKKLDNGYYKYVVKPLK